jgi:L-malate glycosyltransferase
MSDRLRILMVNYEYPPIGGGAANANLNILVEMAATGRVEVDLVTSFAGNGVAVEKLGEGVKIHKVGISKENLHHWRKREVLSWMYRASGVYKNLLAENEYDLAHCFFAFPSGWFCLRHKKKLPYIISLRGSDVPGYNDTLGLYYFILKPLFRSIWKNAASIIANSCGLAALANRFTPNIEIDVIPNGVRVEDFSQHNVYRRDNRTIRLLTVGRLVNRKRIDIAIEAVALLKERGFDVHLDIAGDGVMADQLKSLAAEHDVEDIVNFLGVVAKHEMSELYSKSDIFVMCSEHEGMSNALLEAMAASLPVVTSNCEGVAELVQGNGFVIEQINAHKLAASIGNLMKNDELMRSMSQASREKAEQFCWKEVARAYIEKYCRIAGKR